MKLSLMTGEGKKEQSGGKRHRVEPVLSSESHACVGASKPLPVALKRYSGSPHQYSLMKGVQASSAVPEAHGLTLKSCKTSLSLSAFVAQHSQSGGDPGIAQDSLPQESPIDQDQDWGHFVGADDLELHFSNLDLSDNAVAAAKQEVGQKPASHLIPVSAEQHLGVDEGQGPVYSDSDGEIFQFDEDFDLEEPEDAKKGGDISPDSVLSSGLRFFNPSVRDLSVYLSGGSRSKLDS